MNALTTATAAAAPVTDTPTEQLVAHLATMLRTSRDFAWVMGPATRTWRLMVAAFAAQEGLSVAQAEAVLADCRGAPARVVSLEEEVRDLERRNAQLEADKVALFRRVEATERELVEARARATALETEALAAEFRRVCP